jgi:hypothetical protein
MLPRAFHTRTLSLSLSQTHLRSALSEPTLSGAGRLGASLARGARAGRPRASVIAALCTSQVSSHCPPISRTRACVYVLSPPFFLHLHITSHHKATITPPPALSFPPPFLILMIIFYIFFPCSCRVSMLRASSFSPDCLHDARSTRQYGGAMAWRGVVLVRVCVSMIGQCVNTVACHGMAWRGACACV